MDLQINQSYTPACFFGSTKKPDDVMLFLKNIQALAHNEVNVFMKFNTLKL